MSGPPLVDAEARRVVREDVAATVVVEAAAGTGKTTELVGRIVRTLAAGVDVGRVAVVTFTEKAAGELKLRLRAELERARGEPARAAALEDAVLRLEEAKIATIHAFCADLLRERPIEAGVDPAFEALSEEEAADLFDEVWDRWLEDALAAPSPALRRALRRRAEDGPVAGLRAAARELARHADLSAPWSTPSWDRAATTEDVLAAAEELLARTAAGKPEVRDHVEPVRALGAILESRDGALREDELEAAIVSLQRHPRLFRWPPRGMGAQARDALSKLERAVARHAELADAELAAALREELRAVGEAYEAAKATRGVLDFDDLLLRALALLRRSRSARARLQARFDRLFVDEFQDTDATQAGILLLLAADDPDVDDPARAVPAAGKLFVVGDPKQSIYRFRRADLGTYLDVTDRLVAAGGRRVDLSSSFRAVPSIQALVDRAFSGEMQEDREALSPRYVPLGRTGAVDPEGQPAVVALPIPHPYGRRGELTKSAVRASQPEIVASFVAWVLQESGFRVRDPGSGALVPVAPRHVCVLLRTLEGRWQGDVGGALAAALSARGVPTLLVGGRALFDREETLALVAAAGAIERPGDELSVYQALRGPLFALPDDVLLDHRSRFGLDPRRPPITALPAHLEPVAEALDVLAELHRGRQRRTPVRTLERLLEAVRGHVALALRPSGEQALANVAQVLELARRLEKRGALSFRAFVDALRAEVAHRRLAEPPLLEEESDAVRLLTVHKAKGLEFPVVVLGDVTQAAAWDRPSRVSAPEEGRIAFPILGATPLDVSQGAARERARERSESLRLAYVAATRARDLLVVPVVGDSPVYPEDGWLAPLQRALTPAEGARPAPSPGCPPFGRDTVIRDDERIPGPQDGSLTPGTYELGGGARFTIWDPATLERPLPPPRGLRSVSAIGVAGADPAVVVEGGARLDAFLAEAEELRARALAPSEVVVTATTLSHDAPGEGPAVPPAPAVRIERTVREEGRPAGARFGELVHHLLEVVPFEDAPPVDEEATLAARALGLDAGAAEAAARAVRVALAHPLLVAARAAEGRGECRREEPVTRVLPDRRVLEGVVDLAFREGGRWTVVDYKTDAELDVERERAYARQVALYAEAIADATGEPAEGVLLLV